MYYVGDVLWMEKSELTNCPLNFSGMVRFTDASAPLYDFVFVENQRQAILEPHTIHHTAISFLHFDPQSPTKCILKYTLT